MSDVAQRRGLPPGQLRPEMAVVIPEMLQIGTQWACHVTTPLDFKHNRCMA